MFRKLLKIASSSAILSILVISPAFAQSSTQTQNSQQGSVTIGNGNGTFQSTNQNTSNFQTNPYYYNNGLNVQTQGASQGSFTEGNFNGTVQNTNQNSTNVQQNPYGYWGPYYGY